MHHGAVVRKIAAVDIGDARHGGERFPFRLTIKLQAPYTESALDSMFVAFPFGKPVSTFPGNALMAFETLGHDVVEVERGDRLQGQALLREVRAVLERCERCGGPVEVLAVDAAGE